MNRPSGLKSLFWLCVCVVGFGRCDQYNPHVYPSAGPFFEGWYIRFMDFQARQNLSLSRCLLVFLSVCLFFSMSLHSSLYLYQRDVSFGCLWGRVLPESAKAAKNLAFVGLIAAFDNKTQLQQYNSFPDEVQVLGLDDAAMTSRYFVSVSNRQATYISEI